MRVKPIGVLVWIDRGDSEALACRWARSIMNGRKVRGGEKIACDRINTCPEPGARAESRGLRVVGEKCRTRHDGWTVDTKRLKLRLSPDWVSDNRAALIEVLNECRTNLLSRHILAANRLANDPENLTKALRIESTFGFGVTLKGAI